MALTRDFRLTFAERVQREPEFAQALLDEAATLFRTGESDVALQVLRDLVDAVAPGPRALAAHYDAPSERILVQLSSGVELAFPVRLTEGLAGADPEDLSDIEISFAGQGLHWPKLDADLYVPGLIRGHLGTRSWMQRIAAELDTLKSPGGKDPDGAT